ncbi:MAG: fumarylacetoacetate hydrolase family protein [Candidatus Riflebacteria bacterium]|nr:fumarylacetoacetate hydrolase family protein [Candidatus Riflebacteria bacterium]
MFPSSAIVGPWFESDRLPGQLEAQFELLIDGASRQRGHASGMTLSPAECVAYASTFFPLCPGDLVFTGTPAGVGPVIRGQKGEIRWGGVVLFTVQW